MIILSFKIYFGSTMKNIYRNAAITACILFGVSANAKVCDYTPSNLAGQAATAVGTALAGGAAVAGVGLQAAGVYTLVHAGSGLTMVGLTAAGTSAAGTVGIVAGTGGVIGATAAFLLAPVTLVVAAVTVVGVGAFEGACYFQVERVTDAEAVHKILIDVASRDDTVELKKFNDGIALVLKNSTGDTNYLLDNLYIADGSLMHRDWGSNTNLGTVLFTPETPIK